MRTSSLGLLALLLTTLLGACREPSCPPITVNVPVTRIDVGDGFGDETARVLVVIDHGRADRTRLSGSATDRSSLLVCAAPAASFNQAVQAACANRPYKVSRLYLGVRSADNKSRALPLLVMPHGAADEAERGGQRRVPYEVSERMDRRAVTRLRLTRNGDSLRCRWGTWPKFDLGDRTLHGRDLGAGAGAAVVPGLAERLANRAELNDWRGGLVFLECSDTVRMEDVVRIVECARADPAVMFVPLPYPWTLYNHVRMELPAADSPDLADLPLPREQCVWVTLLRSGRYRVKGDDRDLQGVIRFLTMWSDRMNEGLAILLRADRRAPWGAAKPVIEFVLEQPKGLAALFFEAEAAGLPYEPFVAVTSTTAVQGISPDVDCGEAWAKVRSSMSAAPEDED